MNKIFHFLLIAILFTSCDEKRKNEASTSNSEISEKTVGKKETKLDTALAKKLDSIHEEDQGLRQKLSDVENEYGRNSEEMRTLWKEIGKKDSLNLIEVKKILDEHGWLGSDVVGWKGNATLFLVIQHADLETQQKYLPLMREAEKRGDAKSSSLALLEDRVALRSGNRQTYGSQIGRDPETGEYYLSPLKDPENVNERRAKMGLGSIEDYLSQWDLEWDAEKYEEELPELEARIRKLREK